MMKSKKKMGNFRQANLLLLIGAICFVCQFESMSAATISEDEEASALINNLKSATEADQEELLQAEESHSLNTRHRSTGNHQDHTAKTPFTTYTGGPGNAYMSIASDGTSRYQFGFDLQPSESAGRDGPRLMRQESRLADGTVIGRYGYTDPFQVFRVVQYVAGRDGYFAVEQVGAPEQPATPGSQPALNRELVRALEQARAGRKRRQDQNDEENQFYRRVDTGEQTPAFNRITPAHSFPSSAPPLETGTFGAPTHEVSFSHQINHLTGSNGQTYSTAFRPKLSARSRLPAPLYTPNSIESSQQQQYSAVRAEENVATPAWSHTYRSDLPQVTPEVLMIQHNPAQSSSAFSSAGNSKFDAEFRRQAALLSSLQARPPQPRPQRLPEQVETFGTRASHSPAPLSSSSFQGLALQQLDPPLYLPEVHETPKVEPAVDLVGVSSGQSNQLQAQQSSKRQLRYATRLSAAVGGNSDLSNLQDDPLFADASEQQLASNAKTASQRAKLPVDRAKKLSAILRSRAISLTGKENTTSETSPAKIRRPMPIGASIRSNSSTLGSTLSDTLGPNGTGEGVTSPETENSSQIDSSSTPNEEAKPVKLSGKKFIAKSEKTALSSEQVSGVSAELVSAKRRPVLRPTVQISEVINNQPAHVSSTTGATIIFTAPDSDEAAMKSTFDKDLYEKIVKIQREIAAKHSLRPTPIPANATSASNEVVSSENLERNSTQNSTLTSNGTLVQTAPGDDVKVEVATTILPNLTTPIENSLQKNFTETKSFEGNSILENSTPGLLTLAGIRAAKEAEQTLLTGPLIAMDSSMDRTDFLSKLTQDMDTFDSVRASIPDSSLTTNASAPVTITQIDVGSSSVAPEPSGLSVPQVAEESVKSQLVGSESSTTPIVTTSPTTTTTTTTKGPAEMISTQISVQTTTSLPTSSSTAPATVVETTTSSQTPTTSTISGAVASTTRNDLIFTTTTNKPIGESTTVVINSPSNLTKIDPPATPTTIAEIAQNSASGVDNGLILIASNINERGSSNEFVPFKPATLAPETTSKSSPNATVPIATTTSVVSTTTATTTEPTVTTKLPTTTSTTRAIPSSTRAPAKFGRLVIKRGDKVVARFNSTDPIPDSMIPIAGNLTSQGEQIVLPDMPRLGMRRAVRRKLSTPAPHFNRLSTTVAPSSNTTTTKVSISLDSSRETTNNSSRVTAGEVNGPTTAAKSAKVLQLDPLQVSASSTSVQSTRSGRNWFSARKRAAQVNGRARRSSTLAAQKRSVTEWSERLVKGQPRRVPSVAQVNNSANLEERAISMNDLSIRTSKLIIKPEQKVPAIAIASFVHNNPQVAVLGEGEGKGKGEISHQGEESLMVKPISSSRSESISISLNDLIGEQNFTTLTKGSSNSATNNNNNNNYNSDHHVSANQPIHATSFQHHIHVRNNQSDSVHVNLDNLDSLATSYAPLRRLVNRDTAQANITSAQQEIMHRLKVQQPPAIPTNRRPRMLCIEVDAGSGKASGST